MKNRELRKLIKRLESLQSDIQRDMKEASNEIEYLDSQESALNKVLEMLKS